MTITISQSASAVAVNIQASFLGLGGVEPYTYIVFSGGAGGTINSSTGVYTAPATIPVTPDKAYDTIQVTDSVGIETPTARILVGTPLTLFCEILQNQMGLANGRVYLWDQKIFQPHDYDLYIAVSVVTCKPFGSSNRFDPNTNGQVQSVNMMVTLDVDIISRGPAARDRKEEVILALNSIYAQQQQNANSFYVGTLPPNSRFINLSQIDGAAIPYRYKISLQMQYFVQKNQAAQYFTTFEADVYTDPKQPVEPLVIAQT